MGCDFDYMAHWCDYPTQTQVEKYFRLHANHIFVHGIRFSELNQDQQANDLTDCMIRRYLPPRNYTEELSS